MRSQQLVLLRTTTTMLLSESTTHAASSAAARSRAFSSAARRPLLSPARPLAAALGGDGVPSSARSNDGGGDSSFPSYVRPAGTYYDVSALNRERLAFQRQQRQQRQQQQRRGLSSFPSGSSTTSSGSSSGSLEEAVAEAAAEADPSSVRPRKHHGTRHNARLVRAWKRGRLGFGFSSGGLLFPYHAGVIAQLRELGIMPDPDYDPEQAIEGGQQGAAAAAGGAASAAAAAGNDGGGDGVGGSSSARSTSSTSTSISSPSSASSASATAPHRPAARSAPINRKRRPAAVHLAGASAGALIAAVANAGVPLKVVEEACVALAADCLQHGTPGRLGPGLRALLERHLPQDAHERCRGNTHVAVTRVVPVWRPTLVSDFASREDLIEALMASAHIPLYLDGRWAARFRGRLVIDGGATSFVPSPPLRERRRRRAAASPPPQQQGQQEQREEVQPLALPGVAQEAGDGAAPAESAAAAAEAAWAFDPDETEHEEEDDGEDGGDNNNTGREKGVVDAVVKVCCFPTWHLASLRSAAASVGGSLGGAVFGGGGAAGPGDGSAWTAGGAGGATTPLGALAEALRTDVSPDAFEPFPYDLATVARWALVASPRETFDFLLARGRRDAALFARESGLEAAAAGERAARAARAGQSVEAARAEPPPPPPAPETPPVAAAVKRAKQQQGGSAASAA